MTAKEKAKWEMAHGVGNAAAIVNAIEELARRNGIGINCNLAAELANCHDALAELDRQIIKL